MNFRQLRQAIAGGIALPSAARSARGARSAAVLILFTETDDPEVTVIERAHTMRRHAGQIAFPGGAQDPGDADVVAAALRESQEEVGLEPQLVEVLGSLPVAWVPRSAYDVTPVVGLWDGSMELGAVDRAEVESTMQLRVADLVDPASRVTGRHPLGFQGPAFWWGEFMIWGFTAYLLDVVFREAGWEQEWDAGRVQDVPRRFLRD